MLVEGLAATITAQAALIGASTGTSRPSDTPTATVTLTASPTGTRQGTQSPKDTPVPTRPAPTDTPVPTTQAPATATTGPGECPYACPGGMTRSTCDSSGVICTASVGHCEIDDDCNLFCPTSFPGLQVNWYCYKGGGLPGAPDNQGVCLCYTKVP